MTEQSDQHTRSGRPADRVHPPATAAPAAPFAAAPAVWSVEHAAGAPEYDSTARLSSAAWQDPAFRADVLRERVENPYRAVPREPGLDAVLVAEECRRARRVRATAGALFLGAVAVLSLFNVLASLTALVLVGALAAAARRRREGEDASRRRGGCLVLLATAVTVVLLVTVVLPVLLLSESAFLLGLDSYDAGPTEISDPGGLGDVLPLWAALLILLGATVGIGFWVRRRTNAALHAIRMRAEHPRRDSGVGTVPVAFYNDRTPFVGVGEPYASWPLTLKLFPDRGGAEAAEHGAGGAGAAHVSAEGVSAGADAEAGPENGPGAENAVPAVAGSALIERLYDRLRTEVPRLTGTEGMGTSTRREVEVADCVFLPGRRQDDITRLAPVLIDKQRWRLREEWVSGFIDAFHERARHFVEVGVSMWESQVVVTFFVRLTTQGGLLNIEGETLVMPPVSPAHQVPEGPLPVGSDPAEVAQLLWAAFTGVLEDLRVNPAEAVAAVRSRSAAQENARLYSWARANREFFDYSPTMGVRHRSAAPDLRQLFQAHDVERVTRAIPEKVLICVRDVLREAGYDTEQVRRIINNVNTNYGNQVFGTQNADGMNFGPGSTTVDKGAGPGNGSGAPTGAGAGSGSGRDGSGRK
ncbi:hypothetical protein [Nocardiopsis tropica]|uniref:Uncharacterized protein n=1 Tax=Nocardiopsis tropica TaxID=109330 RepID=A0ABU7KJA3_9ACTN|nr:hypothetical protein [Nocardiopsis umidischolae]MEE2049375.1 hypothetical protein [Nocardiopsis umidischolae]